MTDQSADDLFPQVGNSPDTRVVNDRCFVRTQDGYCVVTVSGMTLAHYATQDRMSEAYAMISLVEQGWASQREVARAFGYSARTVRRHERRFEAGGLAALGRESGYPQGRPRGSPEQTQLMERLKRLGHSNRHIAHHLGVSETAIRKRLRRIGWHEPLPEPMALALDSGAEPNRSPEANPASAPATPAQTQTSTRAPSPPTDAKTVPATWDTDPMNRQGDRLFACLGLLDDAAPLFGSQTAVPRAGVLLAMPALVHSGVFEGAQAIYGSLGPAFYGLRTSVLTLLLMALWRIKRPEGLKEYSPQDLGRVLGLDRAPEVKTLRRKLTRLAAAGHAAQFGQALAQQRIARRSQAVGFLYVDGHVRVYHGQHRLPKTHVARLRLARPATTDYWVNDAVGDPLFVVTAEANAGLVKMLPGILDQVRRGVGARAVTVAFDRGGFSPKLFQQILKAGFDLLTYRKGRCRRIPRQRFQTCQTQAEGKTIRYRLADQEVRLLQGRLRLRQVTRLAEDGHQTPILTSRRDLPPAQVAYRMFERWRQENFFKYLREEYALDALAEHAAVPDDALREVPNPAWAAADAKLRRAYAQLELLQAEYGLEVTNHLERCQRTMRGFKIAHGALGQKIDQAMRQVLRLTEQRAALPKRIPVQALPGPPVMKLAPERKHLTNLLKMVAYQAESDLLRTVAPHYRRVDDEGRTLIQSALASAADLEVTRTELRITLAPLSSLHRTRAIAALCEELNQTATVFPGSRLRLRYAIREAR